MIVDAATTAYDTENYSQYSSSGSSSSSDRPRVSICSGVRAMEIIHILIRVLHARSYFCCLLLQVESKENKSASKEEDDGSEPAEPRREISDLLPDELIQFRLHLTPPLGMVDSADMQVTVDSADMQVTLPAEYPRWYVTGLTGSLEHIFL